MNLFPFSPTSTLNLRNPLTEAMALSPRTLVTEATYKSKDSVNEAMHKS